MDSLHEHCFIKSVLSFWNVSINFSYINTDQKHCIARYTRCMKSEYYKTRSCTGKMLTGKSFSTVCLYCSVHNPAKYLTFQASPPVLKVSPHLYLSDHGDNEIYLHPLKVFKDSNCGQKSIRSPLLHHGQTAFLGNGYFGYFSFPVLLFVSMTVS